MKLAARRMAILIALPLLGLALGGCGGVMVSGGGYTPVYGDYGYVGPWDSGRVEVEGGYYVSPPSGRSDRDRRGEDNRRVEDNRRGEDNRRQQAAPERNRTPERQAPVQHAAPVQREAPRSIPPIPNHPRPKPPREKNDRDKNGH